MNSQLQIQRRAPVCSTSNPVHDLPLVSRVLTARGILDSEELQFRLSSLPRPEGLLGLEAAIDRIVESIQKNENILIVGDYDCDGATSTTLALRALESMGATRIGFRVPNRLEFGYGLSPRVVDSIIEQGNDESLAGTSVPDLIITVDNGVASVEGVERAKESGIDVVVTDHHLPPPKLPEAVAIVNPNIPGATFPGSNLAGVGVIFFVMIALRSRLQMMGWFDSQSLEVPTLADYLDLVAIGTIADVVELDGINRILVEQGLRRIRAGQARPGVQALCEVAGVQLESLASTNIGFALGPRINAAGRIADIDIGIHCLLSETMAEARSFARELDRLNRERRTLEMDIRQEAEAMVTDILKEFDEPVRHGSNQSAASPLVLCLYEQHWHEGVIGIVAGRLKDRLNMPAMVFGGLDGGMIKGSGRSIPGLHLRDVLQEVSNRLPNGVLQKFGGHAMAAGLTLRESDYAEFTLVCDQVVREALNGSLPGRVLETDGALETQDFDLQTADLLRRIVPWGQGFPEPVFDGQFVVAESRILKEKHLKVRVYPLIDGKQLDFMLDAIAFEQAVDLNPGAGIRLVYRLGVNEYRGTSSLQLMVLHLERT